MTESSAGGAFIHLLALGVDPAWRREPYERRCDDARAFIEAERAADGDGVSGVPYSSIGLEPGVDLLLWRFAASVDALELAAARSLRSGLGSWLQVRHSFLSRLGPSQYVTKPSEQEQGLLAGERSRYLVVYPFTKSTDWYLLHKATRQGIMDEHIQVGQKYPGVKLNTTYSFGLDDQDFVVAFEGDYPEEFLDLVMELRETDGSRYTVRDTPIITGVKGTLEEIVATLG